MKNKSIFNRIYRGLQEGYKLEIVPQFLINFEKKIYVKLFKLLGGITTAFILTGIASNYNNKIIFYSAVLVSMPYLLYKIAYTIFVMIEVFKIIKNKSYQVRNSPVDPLSNIFKGIFVAITGKFFIGAGIGLSLAHEIDKILEDEGRERVFEPAIKKGLNKLGGTNGVYSVLDQLGITKQNTGLDSGVITKAAIELGVTETELLEGINIVKERKSLSIKDTSTILKTIEEQAKKY